MEIIAKYVKNQDNIKSFNINNRNNKDIYQKLIKAINRIQKDGLQSNLKQSTKYPDNCYFTIWDGNNNLEVEKGFKYQMVIKLQPPNTKGYVNVKIEKYNKTTTPEYVNYFDICSDSD